ncbi:MAG: hypothetical protein M5R36_06765 [Deltaproteobacteria bacterium]|nr:hypothetical protein [Deltaproteobacteria bacterium]
MKRPQVAAFACIVFIAFLLLFGCEREDGDQLSCGEPEDDDDDDGDDDAAPADDDTTAADDDATDDDTSPDDDASDDDTGADDDADCIICASTTECTDAFGEGWGCVGDCCVEIGDDDTGDDDTGDDDIA